MVFSHHECVLEQYSLAGDLLELRVGFSQIDLKFGSFTRRFVKHTPGVRELGLVKRLDPRHLKEDKTPTPSETHTPLALKPESLALNKSIEEHLLLERIMYYHT